MRFIKKTTTFSFRSLVGTLSIFILLSLDLVIVNDIIVLNSELGSLGPAVSDIYVDSSRKSKDATQFEVIIRQLITINRLCEVVSLD